MHDISSVLGRTLILVAHPDDETVGCATLLQRMQEAVVVFCTDGAPSDEFFWQAHGSRLRYARAREEEARSALGGIGVSEVEFLGSEPLHEGEGIRDQELHNNMDHACRRLSDLVKRHRPRAIVTLAYEGGHPDHDACSVLAWSLGIQYELGVWEFPLYHRMANGQMAYQRFVVPNDREEIILEITPQELENKQSMLQAYASQQPFLSEFDPKIERFRPQHAYDYSRPPHPGQLNYEAWQWRATGAEVCTAFGRFVQAQSAVKR
jgi:LmbE family N-acetylglucosaminyl deacetylase